ncbi:MAG: DUF47 domain-containing protein [Deltaproteobacteria bacterium]|nr:DUF47 domain-containing protein [Deltaproteobacteria bacterium]
MFRFLPKEEKFFDYFDGASEKMLRGIGLLEEMMQDLSNVDEKARQIKYVEHEADHITHETVSSLHKTFVTPIDRESIYALITKIDDVLDLIDSVCERVFFYKIKTAIPEAIALTDILGRAVEQVTKGVNGLRNLKEHSLIFDICIETNRLENEADRTYRKALSDLFNSASDPVEIIKWKDIYETLEEAIDRCEDVAKTS